MRTARLAKVAAEAEILLVRREMRTRMRRAAYGAVAAVFAVAALVLLHVLAYMALVQFARLAPFYSVLTILGADIVIVAVFAALASGAIHDPVAAEARRLRDQSLEQIRESITAVAVLRPAGRYLGRKHIYGLVLAALTARYLGAGKRS